MTVNHAIRQFSCLLRVCQKRTLAAILAVLIAVPIIAQSPAVPVQPYSEVEQLKIANVNLEGAIVRRAVEDWQRKVSALKAELESKRPGWEWRAETGEWAPVKRPSEQSK